MISRRAILAAPAILGAADKAGTKRPVIGTGEHTYEVFHDWGETPARIAYGNTHAVAEDSNGHIYIAHTVHSGSVSKDTVVVFDAKGKFLRSWGPEFTGGAHGLQIRKEGSTEYLYLVDNGKGRGSGIDTAHTWTVKLTLRGEEVFRIGYPKEAPQYKTPNTKFSPTNVAFAPNGDFYIADGYGSFTVSQYDQGGRYIRTFGGNGAGPGQLACPHGLIVDTRAKDPVLLVADRENNRLQTFTLDGKHLAFYQGVKRPCHFAQHKGVMLIPDLVSRLTLLDRENRVIAHLGEDTSGNYQQLRKESRDRFPAGKFVAPHGACFDHSGNIFVAEWVEVGRVSKLRKVT